MGPMNYSEAYKYLLNFVHLIESDEPSYTIFFEKEGSPFPVDAKFNVTTNGDYALSFSTKSLIHPQVFDTPLIGIHSENYSVFFESLQIRRSNFTFSTSAEKSYHIETKSFRSTLNKEWKDSHICAFYKYDHSKFNPRTSCIINNEVPNGTYCPINITIGGYDLIIFWGDGKPNGDSKTDERYLTFFSKSKTDYLTFKKIVDAIRVVWGIVTGYYIGKSVYYVSYMPEIHGEGLYFAYNNLQEDFVSNRGLLDYIINDNLPEQDLLLTKDEFERLINLLYYNESFYRAGQLLLQAIHDEGLSKGGIAAIALETITGEIEKQFKSSKQHEPNELKMPNELLEKIQNIIISFKEKSKITDEQLEHYLKRLNGFSEPLNKDKLFRPFMLLNINLSETEKGIIKNRNTLLHGNLPKVYKGLDFASKLNEDDLIFYVSNKLIMLCGMLLFGMAKINKLIIDWGVTIIVKKRLIESGRYFGGGGKKHREVLDSKPKEDSPDWIL